MSKKNIYIKKIELKDFESHKHTVLDNFSKGFNCISGTSDLGKTSILRALMLCAYNQFSPESIRLGAEYCDVTVTSNIGSVNVKRGNGMNLWTVIRDDKPEPMVFDKVGRNEVQEACAVLGMKIIQLGDIEVPVNIMSQLENHFLISAVGDEKTSGSGRAQIIDEICGLNGAEELIKAISLDQNRVTRKITEAETRIKELEAQLHSESDIRRDEKILKNLEQLEENIKVCKENKEYVSTILESHIDLRQQAILIQDRINRLPNIKNGLEIASELKEQISKFQIASKISKECDNVKKSLSDNRLKISSLPDIKGLTNEWKEWVKKLELCKKLSNEQKTCAIKLDAVNSNLKIIHVTDITTQAKGVLETLEKLRSSRIIYSQSKTDETRLLVLKDKIKEKEQELIKAEQELTELYKNISVCPITKRRIGEKCSLDEINNPDRLLITKQP